MSSQWQLHSSGFAEKTRQQSGEVTAADTRRTSLLQALRPQLNSTYVRELDSLAKESNSVLFCSGLLELGSRLEKFDQVGIAAKLYQLVQAYPGAGDSNLDTAKNRLVAILGSASPSQRLEFLLFRFRKEATDYRTIVPAIAGSAIFTLGRSFGMARLSGLSQAWYSRGRGAEIIASAFGFSLEAGSFGLLNYGLRVAAQDESTDRLSLEKNLFSSALSLGALRLGGFLGDRLVKATSIKQAWLTHGTSYLGMLGAHYFEKAAGFRGDKDGANEALDMLATFIGIKVGMRLGQRALGNGLNRFQAEIESRAENIRPFRSRYADSLFESFLQPAITGSGAAGYPPIQAWNESSMMSYKFIDRILKPFRQGAKYSTPPRQQAFSPYRSDDQIKEELPEKQFAGILSRHINGGAREAVLKKTQFINGVLVSHRAVVRFHENGNLATAVIAKGKTDSIWPLRKGDSVSFDDNGNVTSITIKKPVLMGRREFGAGTTFEFNHLGRVIKVGYPKGFGDDQESETADPEGVLAEQIRQRWLRDLKIAPFINDRIHTAYALAQWGHPADVFAVRDVLRDFRDRYAIWLLGKLRDRQSIPDLLAIARNPKAARNDRTEAMTALSRIFWNEESPAERDQTVPPSEERIGSKLYKVLLVTDSLASAPMMLNWLWHTFLPGPIPFFWTVWLVTSHALMFTLRHRGFSKWLSKLEREAETFQAKQVRVAPLVTDPDTVDPLSQTDPAQTEHDADTEAEAEAGESPRNLATKSVH